MLEENSQIAFFKKHLSKIVFFLVIVVGAAFFLEKKLENKKIQTKNDFVRVAKLFSELQMGHDFPQESIEEMKSIVKRNPCLAPKYEPCVVLALLSQRQEEQSVAYLMEAIKRREGVQNPVHAFSELSLVIEQKDYDKALVLAKDLDSKLENSEYPTLHCYNLLRILFLAQQSNDVLLTKVTWDKLRQHTSWAQIAPLFQEGSVTFQDYLACHLP